MSSNRGTPGITEVSLRIALVSHDPTWAEEYITESSTVSPAFGDLFLAIHHIGSTAIPGMDAKPVIDMLAVVTDTGRLDEQTFEFERLGYEAMGEFGIPGRRYFRKDSPEGKRTHQIHAFQVGSSEIERHLAFRDFLRAHPERALQYSALKLRLADEYPNDIAGYTDGKSDFIRDIDTRAAAWRSEVWNGQSEATDHE